MGISGRKESVTGGKEEEGKCVCERERGREREIASKRGLIIERE